MNVLRILEKRGRIELADLANLLLSFSVVGKKKDDPDDEESGEDCEGCEEEDEEMCEVCRLRRIIHTVGQNGKPTSEDTHSPSHKIERRVSPLFFWAEFATSGGKVGH